MTNPNNLFSSLQKAITNKEWQIVSHIVQQLINDREESRKTQTILKIGKLLRQAEQWQLAIDTFLLALKYSTTMYEAVIIHQNLSEMYHELLEYDKASQHGSIAIAINDQQMMLGAPNKKIIAFSLFGGKPVYCENLMINLQKIPEIYPSWQASVYHDSSVPANVLSRLKEYGAELIHVKDIRATHLPGTFWRFFALERQDCTVVIMRDADSIINEREKRLVEEWLNSDKPFHIIRDWYGQTDLILAGLWGVRNGFLSNIRSLIEEYIKQTPVLSPTHADQNFLAAKVWPRIRDFAIHHSSVFNYDQSTWPNTLPRTHYLLDGSIEPLGSWLTTYLDFKTESDFIFIIHEGEKNICQYIIKKDERIELPRVYQYNIESGRWQVQIFPIAIK